jgi:hypothetical protein
MTLKELKEMVGKYRRVFSGKDGEAVLADLKKRCFVKETTFSENHGRMAFNEGRRSIFAHITNMKETDPDKLTDLPREYQT